MSSSWLGQEPSPIRTGDFQEALAALLGQQRPDAIPGAFTKFLGRL
jgi:hypothetical protein